MRSFIILSLFAASYAASLGYNYGPGQTVVTNAHGYGGSQLIGSGGLISSGGYGSGLNLVSTSGLVGTGGLVGSGGLVSNGGYVSGGSTRVIGIDANAILNSVPQTVEYSKQFYHFEAPEEEHHAGITSQQLSNVLKKNLQVVFIKAPENNAATNAALQVAKQAIEQKTAIYVLSKENDASQVIATLGQIQENVQTAPEVRFIKYRTPADIEHAKHQIQAEYDNAPGHSEVYNGGVAPVLNYASPGVIGGPVLSGGTILGGHGTETIVTGGNVLGGIGSTGQNVLLGTGSHGTILNSYLPPPL